MRLAATKVLSVSYRGHFINPVVILGVPPRGAAGFAMGGNEPSAHIISVDVDRGTFSLAIRPRCGEAVDRITDDTQTVQISWLVVETGELDEIAAGTATSACSGGSLCSTAAGCTAESCYAEDGAMGLDAAQVRFSIDFRLSCDYFCH